MSKKMRVMISLKTTAAGGRQGFIANGYRPQVKIKGQLLSCHFDELKTNLNPGESGMASMSFILSKGIPNLEKGLTFDIHEGARVIGAGIIADLPKKEKKEDE